jgi:hypothetical protein
LKVGLNEFRLGYGLVTIVFHWLVQNFQTPSTCSRVMPVSEPAGLGLINSVKKHETLSVKESYGE